MAYKTIDETFWTDPKIKKIFSCTDKLLYLYFISNKHTHYSGIYYLPKIFVIDETGLSLAQINKFLATYQSTVQYDDKTEIIWVTKMAFHQMKQGNKENLIKGIASYLATLHNTMLIKSFLIAYEYLDIPFTIPSEWDTQPIAESVSVSVSVSVSGTGTGCRDEIEIISYLNSVLGTNYKPDTKETVVLIRARLKKFTVEDFKTVIDKKYQEWGKDEKMCKFLRPETLFGTKFESYLNQPDTTRMIKVSRSMQNIQNYMERTGVKDEEGRGAQDSIEISGRISGT